MCHLQTEQWMIMVPYLWSTRSIFEYGRRLYYINHKFVPGVFTLPMSINKDISLLTSPTVLSGSISNVSLLWYTLKIPKMLHTTTRIWYVIFFICSQVWKLRVNCSSLCSLSCVFMNAWTHLKTLLCSYILFPSCDSPSIWSMWQGCMCFLSLSFRTPRL